MSNFEAGLSDAEFILDFQVEKIIFKEIQNISYSQQDQSDSYCLLNSILSFEETSEKSSMLSDNGMGKDNIEWLNIEFKEEANDALTQCFKMSVFCY